MKMKILVPIIFVTLSALAAAFAVKDYDTQMIAKKASLEDRCNALNLSTGKKYRYFQGTLTKGYLFVMPYLPEPEVCKSDIGKCDSNKSTPVSYALNLKNKNGKTISLPVYGERAAIEDYAFKEGEDYAICYTLDIKTSEKNKREIWMVETLEMVEKMGE